MLKLMLAGIIIASLPACSSFRKGKTPYFDLNPETVIFYADIRINLPRPTQTTGDGLCPVTPTVRVWGDGLAYYGFDFQNQSEPVLTGKLGPATLQKMFAILNSDHFFAGWKVPEANPGGLWLILGAHLKDRPVLEYSSGDMGPPVYRRLVEAIKPELKPLAEQAVVNARIEALLKEYENCNAYLLNK